MCIVVFVCADSRPGEVNNAFILTRTEIGISEPKCGTK